MLMLLFQIGNERYALESKQVVEVIPMVRLRKIYRVPEYVAGLLDYRGMMVPTIDLCHLIQGKKSRFALSTRIILIHYHLPSPENRMKSPNDTRLLGMIAEQVTEVIQYNSKNSPKVPDQDSPLNKDESLHTSNYLGDIFFHQQEMIQQIDVNYLLPIPEKTALFSYLPPDQGQ